MPLTACSHHACPCCCTACERDRLRAELAKSKADAAEAWRQWGMAKDQEGQSNVDALRATMEAVELRCEIDSWREAWFRQRDATGEYAWQLRLWRRQARALQALLDAQNGRVYTLAKARDAS